MLKLSYLETEIVVEQLTLTTEAVVAQRSVLALRVGQPLMVQQSYGSFLLPTSLPGASALSKWAESVADIEVDRCDLDWLEVTFRGIWIAETPTSDQGILVVELEADLEQAIVRLWQRSQVWLTEMPRCPKLC